MWKQKIGFSVGNSYEIPTIDVVKILSQIGFDAISPEWQKDVNIRKIVETAREYNLTVQSLHAPFNKSDDMWSNDENLSGNAKKELRDVIDCCKELEIPIMVAHTWIGFDYTFENTEHGFRNYGEIVDYAKENDIKIAFENTEGEEYLFALMDYFKNDDTVGFCWDSGHELCYNHSKNLLEMFGDRLLITHLNDNLGISRFDGKTFWTDDLHLLPYDGIADWDYNIERLRKSNKLDILNFELSTKSKPDRHENDVYSQMELTQYLTEVYKRACRIAYKYSK